VIIVFVGMLIFWAGFAAWCGSTMAQNAHRGSVCVLGAALTVAGVAGILYGMRLLVT